MVAQQLVLIDTCMWVDYFNRPKSAAKQIIDELIDENRAALIANVVIEVLQGFRRNEQADWVAASMQGLRFFPLNWNDCRTAAKLSRELAARNQRLPLTDLTLAAVALRTRSSVYTIDPHFDLLPQVGRLRV